MKKLKRLLIVDDEAHIRRVLQVAFEKERYSVSIAEDFQSAIQALESGGFDCVVTDVTMPGRNGYELLNEIQQNWPETPVIVITAYGTIPQAVKAMRDGAFEFLTKPVDLDLLKKVVARAADGVPSVQSRAKPSSAQTSKFHAPTFASESMREIFAMVDQVAESKATALITGESGVGKEVVARALHERSSRSAKPFVAVSCAALPDTLLESELFGYEKGAFTGAAGAKAGRFELAESGTLFLDEIGEIPALTQVKLLRVLQEREFERLGAEKPTKFDARLVAATNRDLQQAVTEGVFRLDLMYRLQVVEIHIPPLRERKEDIEPLVARFSEKFCADNARETLTIEPEALNVLMAHNWPGNVRELENLIERAVALTPATANAIEMSVLPLALRRAA